MKLNQEEQKGTAKKSHLNFAAMKVDPLRSGIHCVVVEVANAVSLRPHSYLAGNALGQRVFQQQLTGKLGVWSKTDSVSYFDDYTVNPTP